MGLIRTLLAMCVVLYHSYTILGCKFTGGRVSVQCFYIISGFYMALILKDKFEGSKFSWKSFMASRLYRLMPMYFFVLLLSFTVSLLGYTFWNNPYYLGWFIPYWQKMNGFTRCYVVFENIFLVGSDLFFYLKMNLNSGALSFTNDPFLNKPLINSFTFIPQAWTLSIEIMFYMLAPFIYRLKSVWLLLIIVTILFARWLTFHKIGWYYDPWTYRCFPLEIAFFVSGGLMFRFYDIIKEKQWARKAGGFLLVLIVALILLYNQTELHGDPKSDFNVKYKQWYFYAVFALSLPFIFAFSKNSRADRIIGELSFPIYLIHHLIMMILKSWFFSHMDYLWLFGITTLALTLLSSVVCLHLIIRPVDRYRRLRFA